MTQMDAEGKRQFQVSGSEFQVNGKRQQASAENAEKDGDSRIANGERQTTMTDAKAHQKAGIRRTEERCTQRPLKKQHVPFFPFFPVPFSPRLLWNRVPFSPGIAASGMWGCSGAIA